LESSQLAEDRALADRVAADDADAFEAFFREYFPRLFRFAMTRSGNDETLSEEVVQRTMCRVVRRMSSYRGEALLFTWLCGICRNELAAVFRERGIEADRDLPLEDHPGVRAALESLAPGTLNPETQQSVEDIARFVRVTLEFLPTHYSTALEMKYLRGSSVTEIADALRVSEKAAESTLTRARSAFREGFRSLHQLEPGFLLE